MNMCFWRKKKKEPIASKFEIGDMVGFPYRDDRVFGFVYRIYKKADGNIYYDIQVAGQCPYLQTGVEESIIYLKQKKNAS
ncbi:MAG: hypothetical protein MJ241_02870 [Bacilli bacterium]|nr:hypothetical protein [Bacilli bacterium]